MSEQPKNVRLPIMVSADEAVAIDDWRFENRVSTRAEAIRELIRRGLLLDDVIDAVNAQIESDPRAGASVAEDFWKRLGI